MTAIPIEITLKELEELRKRKSNINGFMASIRLRHMPKFKRIYFRIFTSQNLEEFPMAYTSLMYEFLGEEYDKTSNQIRVLEEKLRKIKL